MFSTYKTITPPKFFELSRKIIHKQPLTPQDVSLIDTRMLLEKVLVKTYNKTAKYEPKRQLFQLIQPAKLEDADTLDGILKWTKIFRIKGTATSLETIDKFNVTQYVKSSRDMCFLLKSFSKKTQTQLVELFSIENLNSLFSHINDLKNLSSVSKDAAQLIIQKLYFKIEAHIKNISTFDDFKSAVSCFSTTHHQLLLEKAERYHFVRSFEQFLEITNLAGIHFFSNEFIKSQVTTTDQLRKLDGRSKIYFLDILSNAEEYSFLKTVADLDLVVTASSFCKYEKVIQEKSKEIVNDIDKLIDFITLCEASKSSVGDLVSNLFTSDYVALLCSSGSSTQKQWVLEKISDKKSGKIQSYVSEIESILEANLEFESASMRPRM